MHKNNLDEVSLANLNDSELEQITELETNMGNKYYIIAFNKNDQASE